MLPVGLAVPPPVSYASLICLAVFVLIFNSLTAVWPDYCAVTSAIHVFTLIIGCVAIKRRSVAMFQPLTSFACLVPAASGVLMLFTCIDYHDKCSDDENLSDRILQDAYPFACELGGSFGIIFWSIGMIVLIGVSIGYAAVSRSVAGRLKEHLVFCEYMRDNHVAPAPAAHPQYQAMSPDGFSSAGHVHPSAPPPPHAPHQQHVSYSTVKQANVMPPVQPAGPIMPYAQPAAAPLLVRIEARELSKPGRMACYVLSVALVLAVVVMGSLVSFRPRWKHVAGECPTGAGFFEGGPQVNDLGCCTWLKSKGTCCTQAACDLKNDFAFDGNSNSDSRCSAQLGLLSCSPCRKDSGHFAGGFDNITVCPSFCKQTWQVCGGAGYNNYTKYCEEYLNVHVTVHPHEPCFDAAVSVGVQWSLLCGLLLFGMQAPSLFR